MPIGGDTIQYGPWHRGVWYSKDEEDCAPDELASTLNCRIGAFGEIRKRPGSASYSSAAAITGTPSITGVQEFVVPPGTTTHVVIFAGATIRYYNSGWSDLTGALTITAGDDNTWETAVAYDTLLAVNGVSGDDLIKVTDSAGTPTAAVLTVSSRFSLCRHVAFWDNRAWYGNADTNYDRAWYSSLADPTTVGASDFYNLGAEITGMEAMQNALALHTTSGIHSLIPTGNSEIPYQLQQRTRRGAINGRSIVTIPENRQMFIADDGIYMWMGGDDVEKKSYQLDLGYWPNVVSAKLATRSFAVEYRAENEVWFFLPYDKDQAAATLATDCMVYNYRFDRWHGPFRWSTDSICAGEVANKPHRGGASDGILHDLVPADTYTDTGSNAYNASIKTASPAPTGDSGDTVRWLLNRTYYDTTGNFDVTVTQEAGGLSGTSETINVSGGGFTLDSSQLDVGDLGTVRMLYADTDLSGYDPHTSIEYINNSASEWFVIRRCHPFFKVIGKVRKPRAGVT